MRLYTLYELFRERAAMVEAQLSGCENADAAAAYISGFLGAMREAYVMQLDDSAERLRASDLLIACQSASGLIAGMVQADVHLKLPGPHANAQMRRLTKGVKKYAAPIINAILCIYLILRGEMPAAIMAAVAAAVCFLAPNLKAPSVQLPEAHAVPRPDPRETTRHLERLIKDVDAILSAREVSDEGAPLLTGPVLESIQMLCEASLTSDGAYALRAASPLVSALEAQGVTLMLLNKDNAGWFDLLPGAPEGRTIRPALVKGGHLLARGQAIAPMR